MMYSYSFSFTPSKAFCYNYIVLVWKNRENWENRENGEN